MSGSQQLLLGGIPTAAPVDPYFYSVTSLLHGDGVNGGQNNTFLDSSTNNFTITRNGNTTQGSFSPFSQTGWGNYFDGATATRLTMPSNTAFAFGTGAYTVEAWIYLSAHAATQTTVVDCGSATGSLNFSILSTGALSLGVFGVGPTLSSAGGAVTLNAWNHVAVVRESTASNATKLYVNGTAVATGTDTGNYTVTTTPAIGGLNSSGFTATGYISNVRLVKGTAVYTSNFTPSLTPLTAISGTSLLTCQSNRFIDNSTNAFAITRNGDVSVQPFSPFNPTTAYSTSAIGGSGYFDGSGDSLSLADNAAWNMGSGDFTAEAWIYPTSFANEAMIMGQWSGDLGGSGLNWALMLSSGSTGYLRLITSSNGSSVLFDLSTSTFALSLNAWQHIAAVRSGNTYTIYVNGVSRATTTNASALFDATNAFTIGSESNTPNQYFTGYISDARVVKGTAVYTAAFTPPTAPLTAISGTSLLCNFTNAGIYDATSKNDLETVGNAQISTTQSKFGGSSMYFDGNGDYLDAIDNTLTRLSGEDFTVEAWVYLTGNQPQFDGGIASYGATSTSVGWTIALTGSSAGGTLNRLVYGVNASASGGAPLYGVSGVPLNTWTHIAVTKFGTTVRFFINGNLDTSGTVTATPTVSSSYFFYVGTQAFDPTATTRQFAGYIDDLRITKGIARYTSNFTPPTTAFLTQ